MAEVNEMTEKELLYLEDALGHEQYFAAHCNEMANKLQDPDLQHCVKQYADRHQQLVAEFRQLLDQ